MSNNIKGEYPKGLAYLNNKTKLIDLLIELNRWDSIIQKEKMRLDAYINRSYILYKLGLFSLYKYNSKAENFIAGAASFEIHEGDNTFYQKTFFELRKYCDLLDNDIVNIIDFNNRAVRLSDLGLYELAKQDYIRGISIIKNNFPNEVGIINTFKFGLSTILLRHNDYHNGWKLYESRFELENIKKQFNGYKIWNGEDIVGKTLLILHEQGIGDCFQFIRYAIYLKQQGVNVIVSNAKELHDFMSFNLEQYGIYCVSDGELVSFDYYCSIMSLPYLTKIDYIKCNNPYLFHNNFYQLNYIESITSKTVNIGIFWQSNSESKTPLRDIPLEKFSAIFTHQKLSFHCLQKDISERDKEILSQHKNVTLYDKYIHNFFDTSYLISKMDLVITVDTSIAHLSGAMNKPTWVLLSYKADFRWGVNKTSCVWYDSVRLFRQRLDYEWKPVIQEIKQEMGLLI